MNRGSTIDPRADAVEGQRRARGPIPSAAEPDPRGALRGALFVALLAIAFLWKPIVHLGDGYLSPADFSQSHGLTRIEKRVEPANSATRDEWTHEASWLLFDAREVARGRLPLWNAWNGGGIPHLANPRSAVLSPFTLPYYVFGYRLATLVATFLRLWAAGFFAFLYLRRIRLAFEAALVGAAAFMLSGPIVLGLGSTASGAAVMLPAGLYALERLFGSFERELAEPAKHRRIFLASDPVSTALLALVLACGWLAGDPGTFAAGLVFLILFAAARGIAAWERCRHQPRIGAATAGFLLQIVAAIAIAAGACAIQLDPFLEYARNSQAAFAPAGGAAPSPAIESWPLQFFPNLLGNPGADYFVDVGLPKPSFTIVTSTCVGGLALFLAVLALFLVRGRRSPWFFALLASACLACAYGLFGLDLLRAALPPLAALPLERLVAVLALCVSILVAFAIDRLARSEARRGLPLAFGLCAAGIVVVWLARDQAQELAFKTLAAFGSGDAREWITTGSSAHVDLMSALFLGGIALVSLACMARDVKARRRMILALALFVPPGWLFTTWHPITPDRWFFPRTEAIDALSARLGTRDFIVIGRDTIPPATNLAYGLRQIAVDDGLAIRRYDQLYRRLFGDAGPGRAILSGSERALQLFGIDCVLDKERWPAIDTAFASAGRDDSTTFVSDEILPGAALVQEFAGVRAGLDALRFWFVSGGRKSEFSLELALEDAVTGERLFEKRYAPGEIRAQGQLVIPWVVRFPAIERAKGRRLRLTLSSDDARAGHSFRVQLKRDWTRWINAAHWEAEGEMGPVHATVHPGVAAWKATQGVEPIDGHLYMDLHHALEDFAAEGSMGGFVLYRFAKACSRYHTVGRALVVKDDHGAWDEVLDAGFDPSETVVLEAVDPSLARAGGDTRDANEPVEILSEDHGHVRVKTTRAAPGWLVTSQPWYPGWKARVGGIAAPLLCANYAFTAVAVPAGESLVELDYEPKSFRKGAFASLASLLCAALWLWMSFRLVAR